MKYRNIYIMQEYQVLKVLYPVTRELKDDVDITIMGVPFDSGVTNRPGARSGPRAIRLSF